jgi:NADPH-dependent ferric siderophore reductase
LTDQTAAPPRKRRPPPRPATVEKIQRVTPRVIRVSFSGPDLASFERSKPGAHMKLFFPPLNAPPVPAGEEAPRPPSRTYTPRRYANGLLDVEFVLHGAGLASDWVEAAKVGDPMLLSGPGGGHVFPEGIRHLVLVADDTAMPAAGMIVEALPNDCRVTVLCEVEDKADERALSSRADVTPTWLHRAVANTQPCALLVAAVAALPAEDSDTHYWIACEAGAMRRMRDGLMQRGIERARLQTRGYWKFGDNNYPDHDYGAD